jgi:beta-lactamase class D
MDGIPATFVFLDVNRDIQLVHNRDRAVTRFSPCSTYKIPNTLIALDTGVMKNAESKIPWDKKKYPKQPFWDDLKTQFGLNWETDHTLASAFENSCVWCYTEIAAQIGMKRMHEYVTRFTYGNMDIDSGSQPFWLDSSLQISAVEQVMFLKRLAQRDLGLSDATMTEALRVFRREQKNNAVLYAKTGGGKHIGWFVGFVENRNQHYVFAFNMEKNDEAPEVFAAKRVSVPMAILEELGVWL